MTFRLILKIAIPVFAGLLNFNFLFSQEVLNPESEFFRIRELALNKDYENAKIEAQKLVNSYPEYGDARILLARIVAWQKKYTEASAILDTLFLSDPSNSDALSLKADIERWSKKISDSKTDIVAGYSFDRFTEPYSLFRQIFKAGATHKFDWGLGSAYLNTGYISAGEPAVHVAAFQFEAEAYPRISSKNYAWLSYAFSNSQYFPSHRAAVELWQALPAGWAVTAGMNYYRFDRDIFIASVSAEKYIGKYWFSLKAFLFFKDAGITMSEYLNVRRYFNDSDYLQLTVGIGTAPDEPFDIQADLYRLSAKSLRLAYFRKFKNAMTLRVGAGYSREEFAESILRNRFEGNLVLTYPVGRK